MAGIPRGIERLGRQKSILDCLFPVAAGVVVLGWLRGGAAVGAGWTVGVSRLRPGTVVFAGTYSTSYRALRIRYHRDRGKQNYPLGYRARHLTKV